MYGVLKKKNGCQAVISSLFAVLQISSSSFTSWSRASSLVFAFYLATSWIYWKCIWEYFSTRLNLPVFPPFYKCL